MTNEKTEHWLVQSNTPGVRHCAQISRQKGLYFVNTLLLRRLHSVKTGFLCQRWDLEEDGVDAVALLTLGQCEGGGWGKRDRNLFGKVQICGKQGLCKRTRMVKRRDVMFTNESQSKQWELAFPCLDSKGNFALWSPGFLVWKNWVRTLWSSVLKM
jgi:hypothetical protein